MQAQLIALPTTRHCLIALCCTHLHHIMQHGLCLCNGIQKELGQIAIARCSILIWLLFFLLVLLDLQAVC